MSVKPILHAVLLGMVVANTATAQPPAASTPMGNAATPPAANAPAVSSAPSGSAASLLANGFTPLPGALPTTGAAPTYSWPNDGGSLPIGRHGPIGQELYTMYGISMANGNGVFGQVLNGGFMIEGGAKALFFDPTQSAAWVLRMGLTLQTHEPDGIPLTFDYFGFDVSVRRLLRFSGIVSIGRDWFLQGALPIANRPANIRYGLDLGTRWGTQRVELNVFDGPIDPFDGRPDYVRRTNNYGGVALGLHGMVEVPMGSWLLFGGFRFEYGYNWGNILPNQNSNIHDVNLLFTTGFRF